MFGSSWLVVVSYKGLNTTRKIYVARRMQGIKGLKFLQYWTSEPDVLCEGMPVLQPSKLVFVGFEK